MEDLDQSNHALDISEMSNVYLDPTEIKKKKSKSKADTGPTHNHNKVTDVHKMLAAQSRKTVSKEYHEKLVKSIYESLSRLRDNIDADFEGGELEHCMSLVGSALSADPRARWM
jgi:ABC-type Zn2+ transport system substrate-binding protein/surface adhesin